MKQQQGYAFLVASLSIVLLLSGVVAYQYTEIKSSTVASTQVESADMDAMKAAALAAKAGVDFVNNLSSSALCVGSTGCNSGVYATGALSGGAASQSDSWWSSSNAHMYSYPGLVPNPLYAIEHGSCNPATGTSTYAITGRAVSQASSSSGKRTYVYSTSATKTWPKVTKTLYDYACDAGNHAYRYPGDPNAYTVSFTAGQAGNISPFNVTQPFPAYTGAGGETIEITEIRVGIGAWSQSSTLGITVRVNGVVRYTGVLSSPAMNATGYSKCASGNNTSVFTLPTPISVNPGEVVIIDFGQSCITGYGCTPSWYTAIHRNTQGQSPGNNSSTQIRYRVIGRASACPG